MNGTEAVPGGYGLYLLQTLLALGAVCLIGFVVIRILSKRLYGVGRKGSRMQVKERLALDQRQSLYLISVDERTFLVGGGEGGVRLLRELDGTSTGAQEKKAVVRFKDVLEATKTKEDQSQDP